MKTAVIIPNWQGRKLLEKNLPSVLKVGFDEVIVVDDASTDGSVNFLESHYPTVKIVRHKNNKGFSSTVNDGVSNTNADIVFLLNSDVLPEKNILKPVLKHFQENKWVFGVSFHEVGYSYALPKFENGFLGHRMAQESREPRETFWVSGGSGAFRRTTWQELGGLDTMFDPFYWEDVDLSYRAWKRGWKLIWEPKAIVEHKHESTINTKYFSLRYLNYIKERNQLLFNWKNLDSKLLLKEHLKGLLWRLRNPGYTVVVFLALLKLPQVIVRRIRAKREVGLTNKGILRNFQESLSVVIVNYNTGNLLAGCVSSVLRTVKYTRTELIIIDNASSDNSFKKIKRDEGVFLIENSKNVGFARAVNQGIKLATADYILLLNPDTVVGPECIKTLLNFAKKNKNLGAVGPKLLNADGSVQPSAFRFPTLWGAIAEFWLGRRGVYSKYTPQRGPVDSLVMAAFLITPQALKKVGLLNEKYFMYFEDLDYCRRLKQAGLKVYYLPEAEIIHYHGISGKKLADEKNQWRRLIPSSKIYHGVSMHYLINLVIWSGQKWQNLFKS